MGYIPPRPQRPGESDAEYIAYLEGLLVSQHRARVFSMLLGLAVAIVIIALAGGLRP